MCFIPTSDLRQAPQMSANVFPLTVSEPFIRLHRHYFGSHNESSID